MSHAGGPNVETPWMDKLAAYYAMSEKFVWNIERLNQCLQSQSSIANTLQIYVSDHSDYIDSYGFFNIRDILPREIGAHPRNLPLARPTPSAGASRKAIQPDRSDGYHPRPRRLRCPCLKPEPRLVPAPKRRDLRSIRGCTTGVVRKSALVAGYVRLVWADQQALEVCLYRRSYRTALRPKCRPLRATQPRSRCVVWIISTHKECS